MSMAVSSHISANSLDVHQPKAKNMNKKLFSFLSALLLTCGLHAADKVTVKVSNPLTIDRVGETVELSADRLSNKLDGATQFVVCDADGREIPSQLTYDGKLIFQANVGGKASSQYTISAGKPKAYEARVFGRAVPERKDDFAWENDRTCYRTYGPALQRSGERAFGYDVFNKRTSRLVVNERFALEFDPTIQSICDKLRAQGRNDLAQDVYYELMCYHVDHGTGQDCYKVGPTLGCGTDALLENSGNDIVYPWCYKTVEILDNGPLRFTFRLTFNPETVDGQEVVETRIISLDAGSHLNKASISFSGLNKANPITTGIVIHEENPTAFVINEAAGYMGYEDLGDSKQFQEKYRPLYNKTFGRIYVGAVYPEKMNTIKYQPFTETDKPNRGGALGHLLGITTLKPEGTYTYYFGSGWSNNPETAFQTLGDWEKYLSEYAQKVKKPLVLKY